MPNDKCVWRRVVVGCTRCCRAGGEAKARDCGMFCEFTLKNVRNYAILRLITLSRCGGRGCGKGRPRLSRESSDRAKLEKADKCGYLRVIAPNKERKYFARKRH